MVNEVSEIKKVIRSVINRNKVMMREYVENDYGVFVLEDVLDCAYDRIDRLEDEKKRLEQRCEDLEVWCECNTCEHLEPDGESCYAVRDGDPDVPGQSCPAYKKSNSIRADEEDDCHNEMGAKQNDQHSVAIHLSDDEAFDLYTFIRDNFTDAFSRKEDDSISLINHLHNITHIVQKLVMRGACSKS